VGIPFQEVLMGKSSVSMGHFSIAMLNNQRVIFIDRH
jgi:hypothetical protein